MKASRGRSAFVLAAFVIASGVARNANAQSDEPSKADARAAYDGAALAHERGDFVVAAREFARADALAPNDVALEQAIESATRAGSAALGMNLVERARARAQAGSDLSVAAEEAAQALGARASKIIITCDGCNAEVDGVDATHVFWVEPGTHVVEMHRGDRVDSIEVHAVAGATIEATPPAIVAAAPPPPPPAPARTIDEPAPQKPETKSGWSPIVFWGAAGVTAIAGGITVASAIATGNDHSQFQAHPSSSLASAGTAAQTRTNIFLGVTGVAAISTAVIGLVLVRWSDSKTSTDVGLAVSPMNVSLGGQFQ